MTYDNKRKDVIDSLQIFFTSDALQKSNCFDNKYIKKVEGKH